MTAIQSLRLASLAAFLALLAPSALSAEPSSNRTTWGAMALSLGGSVETPPILDAELSQWNSGARLERFYRAGGEGEWLTATPVTPTQARVMWDADHLYVAFRCVEPSRYAWAVSHESGPRAALNHPDRVELSVRPDFSSDRVLQFAVASDGTSAWRDSATPALLQSQDEGAARRDEDAASAASGFEARGFEARVVGWKRRAGRDAQGWTAGLTIPWRLLGGRPDGAFGLNFARFRHQSGEFLSPMGLDHTYYPPGRAPVPNGFLEARCGGAAGVLTAQSALSRLPSGALMWQRPAVLSPLTPDEQRALMRLQDELASVPTSLTNLSRRVALAGRFHDVFALEGFAFGGLSARVLGAPGVDPRASRARVNKALRDGKIEDACRLLDETLRSYDLLARKWWADGSPGNVRDPAWSPLVGPFRMTRRGQELLLQGRAATSRVTLALSPTNGGVRLRLESGSGFPESLASQHSRDAASTTASGSRPASQSLSFAGGPVRVLADPWRVTVSDAKGREAWHLGEGDLRFRFEGNRIAAVDLSHALRPGEAVHGFGEWSQAFNTRGQVLTLWQQDAWEALNGGLLNQSYKTIPFYHLSRGASVFFATPYRLRADIGQARPDRLRLTASGPVLDAFVWLGTPLQNLNRYTELTGRSWLPPRWAFEPWAGGGHKRWADGPLKNAVAEQLNAMRRFAELDIPHAALYAEGASSSDPKLYQGLAPLGVRVLTWNRNQVSRSVERDQPEAQLPFLRRSDGGVYRIEKGPLRSQFPYLDWSHPGAMELWRESWRRRLDLGVAGSMIDFGDWTPEDALAFDGTRGDALHNVYALGYHRAAHEVFRERRGNDFVLFARQAAPGSQRYVTFFAGDHLTNFRGMQAALRAALSFSSSGASTWSVELGGYSGGWPDPETYIRWTQWAAFSPLMRSHGQTPREPWEYGPQAVDNYKRHVWIRYNLLPAIYSYARQASRTGTPMLRPLALAYPGEARLQNVDDAYLLGPDLLVAPMMRPGEGRSVTLPPGRWTHIWSGQTFAGQTTPTVRAPLDETPVLLREGALLPVELAPSLKWGDSMTPGRVRALVVTPPSQAETRTGDGFVLASRPTAGGFEVTQNEWRARHLLVYGARVSSVRVDGRALPPSAWRSEGGRVVVDLPANARRVQILAA